VNWDRVKKTVGKLDASGKENGLLREMPPITREDRGDST